jgi:hypothetical protein
MPEDLPPTLERMEAMLRHCRRRIVVAGRVAGLREGFRAWLGWLPGIAAVFLVLRVLARAFATPAPGGMHLAAVIVLLGALLFGRALVRRGPVRMMEAAERLDLAQANHNRIATAMALLKSGDDSPFARAAICDGAKTLERSKSADPQLDRTPLPWHRSGLSLAAAGVLVLAGFFVSPKHGVGRITADLQTAASTDMELPPGVPAATDPTPGRMIGRAESVPREPVSRRPETAKGIERGQRPEPGTGERSDGAMAHHASGESRGSRTESNSSSAANGGGAKSEPGDNEPGQPPKPRAAKRLTAGQPKANPQEEKLGGSIGARGSSGAGSMQTAQNEWSSQVKAKSDESDEFREEEEPDEEMDPDKQRLGAQPALKNRSSQVSRELSLFTGVETANQQNRGRGGPGGPKKSRGTATMIMGVPIPGFVRGRLLPGPTKSTQEAIEPAPVEGEYATATDHSQARPEEEPQERYRPAAADAVRARDYLLNTHGEPDPTLNGNDDSK